MPRPAPGRIQIQVGHSLANQGKAGQKERPRLATNLHGLQRTLGFLDWWRILTSTLRDEQVGFPGTHCGYFSFGDCNSGAKKRRPRWLQPARPSKTSGFLD